MQLIVRLTGFKGKIVWDTTKPNGQPRRMLDVSRARERVGFVAETVEEKGCRGPLSGMRRAGCGDVGPAETVVARQSRELSRSFRLAELQMQYGFSPGRSCFELSIFSTSPLSLLAAFYFRILRRVGFSIFRPPEGCSSGWVCFRYRTITTSPNSITEMWAALSVKTGNSQV